MATSNEKEFKVGDVVWDCSRTGKGRVFNVSAGRFGVEVKFKSGEIESYDKNGYHDSNYELPTLYHQPYTITLQEISEELPEIGTPVYVWDDESTSSRIAFFLGKSGSSYETCPCFPFTGAQDRWQNMSLTLPDKFK
jgi:hypothetical protein